MDFARALWMRIETLHAVTYFGPETQAASKEAGLDGFWVGYFGFRAAPLGPVAEPVVTATFSNFAPSFVARWVPAVWKVASPKALVTVRSAGAAVTLRRLVADLEPVADAVAGPFDLAIQAGSATGRPLFAANRALPLPADPVEAIWQRCTTLREHRGDGHVAALTAAGLSGLEAHILLTADTGAEPDDMRVTRGWTVDEWAAAAGDLSDRGLLTAGGAITDAGGSLRRDIEATTDRLASAAWSHLDEAARHELIDTLTPAATAVARSGVIRFPNPMGLPPLA